ncbi:hypothetical protein GOP47_0011086 [Adiantum capillus-veneris]|uniref:Calcineurin-like phosphoesterase domain-containing protein n=1 Tax=Adiantum capillus-veneris TaxID=13818 RepID=A0A9D4ZF24_ADICA|nr:hypothetical protein GOP47_0011086 [Adiantum capillus-veneris]
MALAETCFAQAPHLLYKESVSHSWQQAARIHLNRTLAGSSTHHRRGLLLGSFAGAFCSNSAQRNADGFFSNDAEDETHFLKPIEVDCVHPPTVVSAPHRRIIAIGDLHGDLNQTRRALRLAGLLSADGLDSWCGGGTVLVQVGDVLDRGGDEIAIISLLRWLNMQAQLNGGAVFQVNGNHETINVEGDFRYVDPLGFYEADNFVVYCEQEHNGDFEAALTAWRVACEQRKAAKQASYNWMPWNLLKMQKGMAARSLLFSPGGPLARELARHGVVLRVNDWLFAHGGVLPHHVEYGLERMNKEVSEWMRGNQNSLDQPTPIPFIATRGYDSVVWSRLYSREALEKSDDSIRVCAVLRAALEATGARGLVVGHTPQMLGANSKCQGQVWRIDVGMSSGMLNAQPQVLEIFNDEVRVLSSGSQNTYVRDKTMNGSTTSVGHYTAI